MQLIKNCVKYYQYEFIKNKDRFYKQNQFIA